MTVVTVTATGTGSFTIPANVTSIDFEAWGAGNNGFSSGNNQDAGGQGGNYISATLSVVEGDIVYYRVAVGGGISTTTGRTWFQKNVNSEADAWRTGPGGSTVSGNVTTDGTVGTRINSFLGGSGGAAQGGGGSRGGSGGGGSATAASVGATGTAGSGSTGGNGGNAGTNGGAGSTTAGVAGTSDVDGGGGGKGGAGAGGAGSNGGAPGGGGGGGGSSSGAVGQGARGQIQYTYTVSGPAASLMPTPPLSPSFQALLRR